MGDNRACALGTPVEVSASRNWMFVQRREVFQHYTFDHASTASTPTILKSPIDKNMKLHFFVTSPAVLMTFYQICGVRHSEGVSQINCIARVHALDGRFAQGDLSPRIPSAVKVRCEEVGF